MLVPLTFTADGWFVFELSAELQAARPESSDRIRFRIEHERIVIFDGESEEIVGQFWFEGEDLVIRNTDAHILYYRRVSG